MFIIINNQRKRRIILSDYADFANKIDQSIAEAAGKEITIALISDSEMKKLNHNFRGKDSTTDVLSFPHQPDQFDPAGAYLGDIAISIEQAARQASENGLPLDLELKQLILHGILHLCGYDHETDNGEMNTLELEYRDKLGIS